MNNNLHITTKHTGKMKGMASLSTSCQINQRCAKNAKVKGSICEKCYAQRMFNLWKTMRPAMENNFRILTTQIIPIEDLPVLNYSIFRIESFGDIANTIHAINYLNLIKKNPQTFFGWWTKNPDFIAKALKETGYEKPDNCNILRSSLFINKPIKAYYPFVDKVFTVYDKTTIATKGIEINCGARSCLKCRKCYEKNDIINVNEQLK